MELDQANEARLSDTVGVRGATARGPAVKSVSRRARQPARLATLGEQGNLPSSFTSFVGREQELQAVAGLLGTHRLLTLAGPPGVGKTRLALHVAGSVRRRFRDGAWLVELAGLAEPALVASVVARALGVRPADRPPLEALREELRDRDLLLVLDNCEHLIDVCAGLAETLLTVCSGLCMLATSRQRLGLTGEVVWRVPSLTLPEPLPEPPASPRTRSDGSAGPEVLHALGASEAGRLFVERARAARPTFELTESDAAAVVEICRRVDGIPLAIELAAARVAHLTPRQIAARLGDRFRLLAAGGQTGMPKHRTLLALVDWSHDLLSDAERTLFRRLSVFAGGWTLDAAEAICAFGASPTPDAGTGLRPEGALLATEDVLDLLAQLVDKSLVLLDEQSGVLRYRLQETLRQYALDRLAESGEAARIRRRHAEHYLLVAEAAEPRLFSSELQMLLPELDREHDNFRAALRWSSEVDDAELGPRLAGALLRFWQVRGHLREGQAWLDRLLTSAGAQAPTIGLARALNASGFLRYLQGDYVAAQPLLEEGLAIRRAQNDRPGIVESLTNLGLTLRCRDRPAEAHARFEEALAISRALGDVAWEGRVLNKLARLVFYEGDYVAARRLHEESLARVRWAGNTWDIAITLGDLGDVSQALGDDAEACRLYAESLALWQALGEERGVAQSLEGFAILDAAQSRPERAVRLLGAARATRERIAEPSSPARLASLERLLVAARAALGEDAFAAAWAAGCTLPPEQAVAEALADRAVTPAARAPLVAAPASRPAADPVALTAREREVAVLLARGLTNQEIADELVVSGRTAEWHVANVLDKLGLHSRAQLAAWLTDQPPTTAAGA